MITRFIALFKASHFIPTLTVTTLTIALGWRTSDLTTALLIGLTFFSGQLIVGWSNDLIDYSDDLRHNRVSKPLVAGEISPTAVQIAISVDSLLLILLTIFGPLNNRFGVLHLVAVLSALAYNAKLKSTVFSFLPYLLSFGLLPIIVLGSTQSPLKLWMAAIGGLFGVGVHVANVFKDLEEDRLSGILGLPQILGVMRSKYLCLATFGGSSLILYFATESNVALIILAASFIYLTPLPRKFAFPFSILLGLATMAVFISFGI
jgi:4-hydroxybenzoate polyprenyltransferase